MEELRDLYGVKNDTPIIAKLEPTVECYQTQELVLYGSVYKKNEDELIQRLRGLCDPGSVDFSEHEMVFSLKTGQDPDVTIRLRRKFGSDANSYLWHFRYIGSPEPDNSCPTIVRKSISSLVFSHNMMEFVKTLGLRMDYEYITKGQLFTKGSIKILINNITKTEKTGNYEPSVLKPLSDSLLLEMSCALPETIGYQHTAKVMRDVADQLIPICNMQKVEYWKRPVP
uniref:Mediator of RNA polymerase II transcription subunit 18 n=1 Tax=Syphacia muris TaxID=451379 RepID=A0A0N5ATZ2_9BILA